MSAGRDPGEPDDARERAAPARQASAALSRAHGQSRHGPFAAQGFAVGDGWLTILDEMAAEIERTCAATGCELPTVLQIKEKFGALRTYVSGSSDAVDVIIARAEDRSVTICEVCGEPGSLRGKGWVRTLCHQHDTQSRRV